MRTEFEKAILEEYDKFAICEDSIKKEQIRNDIRRKLITQKELSSENHQVLGLIDYEREDWKNYSERILKNFSKSVEKDKTNFLAQLYLAHTYHDIGNLRLALKNYLKVDSKALKEYQVWRYVNLVEQIGYCTYKLGNVRAGIVFFEKVLKRYKEYKDYDLARPTELIECLPENHKIVIEIKKIENYLE